ncbi:hypothetical protein ACEPAH_6859 [Sanghuangporus vaninii]
MSTISPGRPEVTVAIDRRRNGGRRMRCCSRGMDGAAKNENERGEGHRTSHLCTAFTSGSGWIRTSQEDGQPLHRLRFHDPLARSLHSLYSLPQNKTAHSECEMIIKTCLHQIDQRGVKDKEQRTKEEGRMSG